MYSSEEKGSSEQLKVTRDEERKHSKKRIRTMAINEENRGIC
jgi:hypothetical protein